MCQCSLDLIKYDLLSYLSKYVKINLRTIFLVAKITKTFLLLISLYYCDSREEDLLIKREQGDGHEEPVLIVPDQTNGAEGVYHSHSPIALHAFRSLSFISNRGSLYNVRSLHYLS